MRVAVGIGVGAVYGIVKVATAATAIDRIVLAIFVVVAAANDMPLSLLLLLLLL